MLPSSRFQLTREVVAPTPRLGPPTLAAAHDFQVSEQSAQWLTGALEKYATNRVLLAPVLAETDPGRAIAQILRALVQRRHKRILVINCNPELTISANAFQKSSFAGLMDDLHSEPSRAGGKAHLVVSASPFDDAESLGMKFEDLLRELSSGLDLIVCVGKPLLAGPESLRIAEAIPWVVVVAEAGKTTLPELNRLLEMAKREPFTILGGILEQRKRYIPRWADRLFGWQ
jgi:Mrp family chromosome partitioning ATPase